MSGKLTKSGIILLVIGGILTLVGLVLFLRVFFVVSQEMNDPFFHHFDPSPFRRGIGYQSGVIGVVFAGIGGYLFKLGLGLTVVGHSGSISKWIRGLWRGEASVTCPNCRQSSSGDPKYCSHCGTFLKKG